MEKDVYSRLSIMMFLEFFIWGAWYVTVGNYMTKIGMSDVIYWAYTVSPIGAIISPFFLGMVADRFFSTEKVLGTLHLIGGAALFLTPLAAEGSMASPLLFILLLQVHMLCYMPTISLANSLAFHHMTNQEKQFPVVRVFGTVGWIVAGVFVSGILSADETALPLQISAAASLILGMFSFVLPHTPPSGAAGEKVSARQILGLDALLQLKSPSFIVFIVSSFLICIPLSVYYAYAPVFINKLGIANPAFKMSFGQMSEAFFISVMPWFFTRLGVKWMLAIGMFAWVLRYVFFALAAPAAVFWMVMGGVILHGICYDFFFVSGQIYVDKKANAKIRGQAQGFLVLVTYGAGMLIGAQASGWIFNAVLSNSSSFEKWKLFWFIPAVLALMVLIAFVMFFKEKKTSGRTVRYELDSAE